MPDQEKRTLALQVAGRSYRVTTTASEADVRRLAAVVDAKTVALFRGRTMNADALVLTAISLAHDAELERVKAEAFKDQIRGEMAALLDDIDQALAGLGGAGEASGRLEE